MSPRHPAPKSQHSNMKAHAKAVAAYLVEAMDPYWAGPGSLPEQQKNRLAGATKELFARNSAASRALGLWLAGDITKRNIVQRSLVRELVRDPSLIDHLLIVIAEIANHELPHRGEVDDAQFRRERQQQQEGDEEARATGDELELTEVQIRERQRRMDEQRRVEQQSELNHGERQAQVGLSELERAQLAEQQARYEQGQAEQRQAERRQAERRQELEAAEQQEQVRRAKLEGAYRPRSSRRQLQPLRPSRRQESKSGVDQQRQASEDRSAPSPFPIRQAQQQKRPGVGPWMGQVADSLESVRRRLRPRTSSHSVPTHLVSTGIARADGTILSSRWTLAHSTAYLYWFSIGPRPEHYRVDAGPEQRLPVLADLRPGTQLEVILFAFDSELVIDPKNSAGALELDKNGGATVSRPVIDDRNSHRLAFPIRTGPKAGAQRLRCNIYHKTRLLQSRVIETYVGEFEGRSRRRSITSVTDYTVASNLDTAGSGQSPRLSLLVNRSASDSHQFRFYGENNLKGDASIDAETLEDLLKPMHKAMRMAAWETGEEWNESNPYRYEFPAPPERLESDLIRMARSGRQLWNKLGYELGRGLVGQAPTQSDAAIVLQGLMRTPGSFEYACPETYRLAIPTALLYDSPLDTQKDLSYCATGRESLRRPGTNLLLEPCFSGHCPSYEDKRVVCPSGFWGYRHAIGLPVSLPSDESGPSEAAHVIPGAAGPTIAAALTTDPAFTHLADHVKRLAVLHDPEEWKAEDERDRVIDLLLKTNPHIVYFLCHGGETDGLPGLLVGDPLSPTRVYITPDNLTEYGIMWPSTRPLVLLNGCRTAALDPNRPNNFVDHFIRRMSASAVIGTEITIFEPLAVRFAELVLEAFVAWDWPLGEAVRHGRLELLREGNPLGLVYIPYGPVGLHLA